MKRIVDKIFMDFEKRVYNLQYISTIHKKEVQEIKNLYNKIIRLKDYIILLDDYEKQVAIFTLCMEGIKMYDNLIKYCVKNLEYWDRVEAGEKIAL